MKPKHKPGRARYDVAFFTPLTIRECFEHLQSGRSNVPGMTLRVNIYDDHRFWVGYTRQEYGTLGNVSGRHVAVAGPAHFIFGPVRFEGELAQTDAGLRVHGRLVAPGWSRWAVALKILLAVAITSALLAVGLTRVAISSSNQIAWVLACLVFFTVSVTVQLLRKHYVDRLARTLLDWITDRLDVERDSAY
ncbi:MAG: hypothetical protein GYB65_08135 [Chloroflexi bacterium]|nr:hypothetical protein [Chloroflexota bacterium]